MDRIGIIVPMYNAAGYFQRCTGSILAQSYDCFTLILVDDGSTDETAALCDALAGLDSRVKVIHQANAGPSAARNRALDYLEQETDCTYVTFADSDDWLHPEYLQRLLATAAKTGLPLCACNSTTVSEETAFPSLPPIQPVLRSPESFLTGNYLQIRTYLWGSLFHRSLWQGVRLAPGRIYEDAAVLIPMILGQSAIGYIDDRLYFYYRNPQGLTKVSWNPKRMDYFWALDSALALPAVKGNAKLSNFLLLNELTYARDYRKHQIPASALPPEEKAKYLAQVTRKEKEIIAQCKAISLTGYWKTELKTFIRSHGLHYLPYRVVKALAGEKGYEKLRKAIRRYH